MLAARPPDLQKLVEAHGGYWEIPWPEYDKVIAAWHAAMRQQIRDEQYEARTTARASTARKVKPR
jgi:hypothetical protein